MSLTGYTSSARGAERSSASSPGTSTIWRRLRCKFVVWIAFVCTLT
jgi:hypothetical protein